jgi:sulfur carrier protein ThiS
MNRENMPIEFTTRDIVASLGFEAQRIVAAVNHYAGVYPLPHPSEL